MDESNHNPAAPSTLASVRVTMFPNAYDDDPKETPLGAVLAAIRSGKWQAPIRRARELFAAWKAVCPALDTKKSPEGKAYDNFKKTLPAFCISGTAAGRKEPLVHSNLIQLDADKLGGELDAVREKLKADPHVAFVFLSPSGEGLKCGVRIDGERHLESFQAMEKHFAETYGIAVDDSVKDPLRLCFVSHDPAAWERNDAEALPLPEPQPSNTVASPDESGELSACHIEEADNEAASSAEPSLIVLPSGSVSISESARVIFKHIAPSRTMFSRGGALVELVKVDGADALDIVKADGFRSRVERFGNVYAWRSGGEGPALKRAKMSLDDARAIMASVEARSLPPIASVLRCPVVVETTGGEVLILGRGYHEEAGGVLVVSGEAPPQVPLAEAVASLRWLVDEFSFQDEGDRSRALAAFLTPALRLGGHLPGNVPIDVAEADASQAGKGYRHTLVATLFNEAAYFVTGKTGGVGSVDESFAAALVSGRPFICLDNFRGRMDSQNLESFLTCPGLFGARIPHRGEMLVDPKKFLLQLSSNGLQTTSDLANRSSIVRIRKRPGFQYRDTLGELQRRQPYFLGCVFAVVAEWLANGKPRTADTRHHFREWCQSLDWIVQNVLGCAPLMDGHEAAQERTSNPALTWLRAVAIALAGENRLGVALIASELAEVCDLHGIEIPGRPADDDRAKRQIGCLCKQVFRASEAVEVDGFTVTRGPKAYRKPSGDMDTTYAYTFTK